MTNVFIATLVIEPDRKTYQGHYDVEVFTTKVGADVQAAVWRDEYPDGDVEVSKRFLRHEPDAAVKITAKF